MSAERILNEICVHPEMATDDIVKSLLALAGSFRGGLPMTDLVNKEEVEVMLITAAARLPKQEDLVKEATDSLIALAGFFRDDSQTERQIDSVEIEKALIVAAAGLPESDYLVKEVVSSAPRTVTLNFPGESLTAKRQQSERLGFSVKTGRRRTKKGNVSLPQREISQIKVYVGEESGKSEMITGGRTHLRVIAIPTFYENKVKALIMGGVDSRDGRIFSFRLPVDIEDVGLIKAFLIKFELNPNQTLEETMNLVFKYKDGNPIFEDGRVAALLARPIDKVTAAMKLMLIVDD